MRAVCGDAPEEPRYRLELGDLLARRRAARARRGGRAVDRDRERRRARDVVAARRGATSGSRAPPPPAVTCAEVRRLIGEAVQLPVDANERRQLDAYRVRARTTRAPPALPCAATSSARCPASTAPTWALLATLAEPELGFGHYLLGLQRLGRGELAPARRGPRARARARPARARRSSRTRRAGSRSRAYRTGRRDPDQHRRSRCCRGARDDRAAIGCSRGTGTSGSSSTPARSTRRGSHPREEQPAPAVPLEDELVLIALVGAARLADHVRDREARVDQHVDRRRQPGSRSPVHCLRDAHVAQRVADVGRLRAGGSSARCAGPRSRSRRCPTACRCPPSTAGAPSASAPRRRARSTASRYSSHRVEDGLVVRACTGPACPAT